ncbi:hypothetical protein P3S68_008733 [Capsicum galapagoense]
MHHDNNDRLKQTRSIFSFHLSFLSRVLKSELIRFKLLKVLALRHIEIDTKPHLVETFIVQEVQTFIVHGPSRIVKITFPEEIWGLMQLRHLKLPRFYLPDCPSGSVDKGKNLDFSNLQTIAYLSEGARAKTFPATLKKLKRNFLSWSCLDIIAELSNLEVLKLMADGRRGEEWYPNVKGFTRLKLLLIVFTNLKYWKSTYDNFPVLESLVLRHCCCLKEIPIEFAEINSLQLIELIGCVLRRNF